MARVLLAEDDKSVREFVSRALSREGHSVLAVEDGQRALAALAAEKFDLLLADIVMPELDGIALSLLVSRDYPDVPILLMTGYAAESQRAHNMDMLIEDVITKPFTLTQICEAASKALEQHGAKPH